MGPTLLREITDKKVEGLDETDKRILSYAENNHREMYELNVLRQLAWANMNENQLARFEKSITRSDNEIDTETLKELAWEFILEAFPYMNFDKIPKLASILKSVAEYAAENSFNHCQSPIPEENPGHNFYIMDSEYRYVPRLISNGCSFKTYILGRALNRIWIYCRNLPGDEIQPENEIQYLNSIDKIYKQERSYSIKFLPICPLFKTSPLEDVRHKLYAYMIDFANDMAGSTI